MLRFVYALWFCVFVLVEFRVNYLVFTVKLVQSQTFNNQNKKINYKRNEHSHFKVWPKPLSNESQTVREVK